MGKGHRALVIICTFLLVAGCFFRFALAGHDYIGYLCFAAAVLLWVYSALIANKRRRGLIVLSAVLAAGLLLFALAERPVIAASKGDPDCSAKYIIVLGAGVNGYAPSLSLTERLETVLDYMERHPESTAVVSGAKGEGESVSEAQAMYTWLIDRGIAPERIIKEERARNTEENLKYSFDALRSYGAEIEDNVAVVSSEYHLYRAGRLADEQGTPVYKIASRTTWPLMRANYFIREAFAAVYMEVRDIL
ncbi:MAG: YdcF family protein [Oscillospiraceae bacterium]|nr:YdcF family protein [Oscillospiraceae bacterium]